MLHDEINQCCFCKACVVKKLMHIVFKRVFNAAVNNICDQNLVLKTKSKQRINIICVVPMADFHFI